MRFYYFAVIIAGIMLMLNLAGFQTPAGSLVKTFSIIDSDGNITLENFKNSELWNKNTLPTSSSPIPGLKFILIGSLIAGLVLGIFGRSPDIRYLTAAMVFALTGLLMGDMIWLYVKVASYGIPWLRNLALLIIAPLTVGLFITALNFWQGND